MTAAGPGVAGAPAGGRGVEAHPAVDVVTGRVAVVLQDRPVVPLTAWLADAVRLCAASGRGLQVVTPPESRLTAPLRFALDGPDTRWVVRDRTGTTCYDGLSGRRLHWDGDAFAPTPDAVAPTPDASAPTPVDNLGHHPSGSGTLPHRGPGLGPGVDGPGRRRGGGRGSALAGEFAEAPDGPVGRRLVLDLHLRQPATATARLGGAVEAVCVALTGEPPRGWGTAEPATEPWDRDELTVFARRRAPQPTLVVVVGGGARPAVATLRVSRGASGVDEAVTVVVGGPGEPPLDALPEVAQTLATTEPLVSLLAQVHPGRTDTTWSPRLAGLPVPVGMAVGSDEVARVGPGHALAAPVPLARRLGDPARPAVWLHLGDGTTPTGWDRLTAVMQHFGTA